MQIRLIQIWPKTLIFGIFEARVSAKKNRWECAKIAIYDAKSQWKGLAWVTEAICGWSKAFLQNEQHSFSNKGEAKGQFQYPIWPTCLPLTR